MPWLSGFGVTVRRLQYERTVLSGELCLFLLSLGCFIFIRRNGYEQVLSGTGQDTCHRKNAIKQKGNIQYLLNEVLVLTPADLLDIFEGA
jgi:hypothetical protein